LEFLKQNHIENETAYIADRYNGLLLIDVNIPASPDLINTIPSKHSARRIYVNDNFAYLGDGLAGLRVIDISEPVAAQEVGFYNTGGFTTGVFVMNDTVFVSDGGDGFYILKNEYTSGFSEKFNNSGSSVTCKIFPNPFSNEVTIQYVLDHAGFVFLEIIDFYGQKVTSLVNEKQRAGKHQIEFDASELPAGIYFYSLNTSHGKQTGKMILMR
jgi:hypothetical protein